MDSCYERFIFYFGSTIFWLIVVIIIWRFFLYLWRNLIKNGVQWCGGPNTWAVVTGATDGIGLEFARQLAAKDYNLFILSRNLSKLNKVKNEITCQYPKCEVRVLAVDFTRTDIYDDIECELKKLDKIHVLVNNVGIFYPNSRPDYFTKIPDLNRFISDIINVNVIACTRLTALVLPRMEAKGTGIIINVASTAALLPAPLMTMYHATKAYMDFFTRGLTEEYRRKGVVIQSLIPGLVRTNMTKFVQDKLDVRQWFMTTPSYYVKRALESVGRYERTTGYLGHQIELIFPMTVAFVSRLIGIDLINLFLYHYGKSIRNLVKIEK